MASSSNASDLVRDCLNIEDEYFLLVMILILIDLLKIILIITGSERYNSQNQLRNQITLKSGEK